MVGGVGVVWVEGCEGWVQLEVFLYLSQLHLASMDAMCSMYLHLDLYHFEYLCGRFMYLRSE